MNTPWLPRDPKFIQGPVRAFRTSFKSWARPAATWARLGRLVAVGSLVAFSTGLLPASAQDAVLPGSIRVDETYLSLGVRWNVSGDANRDSQFRLEYRVQNAASWQPAAPAMRATPETVVDGAALGLSYWAASALFLESGSPYELRLTLEDPDGGGEQRVISARTRLEWDEFTPSRELFVVPRDGGASNGSGTQANPFRGLQVAADRVRPGDLLHVASGRYESFQMSTSGQSGAPIVFRGPDDLSAVIDGEGTARGVVTLGTNSSTAVSWIGLEQLTIEDGRWGIDAQHSSDIHVSRNHLRDVSWGYVNRREAGLEANQTLSDNLIEGRTSWPGSGIPGERGIDLRGSGNVVRHNRVHNFGDCITLETFTGDTFGNDVYGNDVSRCVDDGVEVDFTQSNSRVWRNRVYNARMGVSLQPVFGGPAYVFRNEFFNMENSPLKLNNGPSGLVIAHNTSRRLGNGLSDGSVWQNAIFRNNLILGTRYAFEFLTQATTGFRDFDFNAWGSTRSGTAGDPWFKWDDRRHGDLADLRAAEGVELRGVAASHLDLRAAALPGSSAVEVTPDTRDLRLVSGAPQIDAGAQLPNLNDPFVRDGMPDMGAFEQGEPLPEYGPRSLTSLPQDPSAMPLRLGGASGTRFEITVVWRTASGGSGTGVPATLTRDTGTFWFFDADNLEMVLKVLDGCDINGRFWVFAAGLTSVQVTARVHDTVTGETRIYDNPVETPLRPIQDTGAFAGCS